MWHAQPPVQSVRVGHDATSLSFIDCICYECMELYHQVLLTYLHTSVVFAVGYTEQEVALSN
jgi:hypothetical protein